MSELEYGGNTAALLPLPLLLAPAARGGWGSFPKGILYASPKTPTQVVLVVGVVPRSGSPAQAGGPWSCGPAPTPPTGCLAGWLAGEG